MRPKTITFTDGSEQVIPVDYKQAPFSLSFLLIVTAGTGVSVQHTYNNPFNGETLTWVNHSSVTNKGAGTYDGSYNAPIRALRVTGTGEAGTLTIVQGQR
jgi:hypothetical protein